MSNFMKIRQVGAELFHADGRTDMISRISIFANAPKNQLAKRRPNINKNHVR